MGEREEKRLDRLPRKILSLLQIGFRHDIISGEKKKVVKGAIFRNIVSLVFNWFRGFLISVCTGLSDRHSLATPITRPE